MRRRSRRAAMIVISLLVALVGVHTRMEVAAQQATVENAPTTIYVYRHAERASETDRDPSLSEAGRARAEALADALEGSGISAIYVTQYRRTGETAAPLARRLGIDLTVEDAGAPGSAGSLAERILSRHAGESVLLVGHSNTVPAIVHAFGGPQMGEFATSRYGDLFILTIAEGAPVRVVHARVDPSAVSATAGHHHE